MGLQVQITMKPAGGCTIPAGQCNLIQQTVAMRWPDGASLRIDVCSRSGNEMIADIYFEEVVQEMSECTPTHNVCCS